MNDAAFPHRSTTERYTVSEARTRSDGDADGAKGIKQVGPIYAKKISIHRTIYQPPSEPLCLSACAHVHECVLCAHERECVLCAYVCTCVCLQVLVQVLVNRKFSCLPYRW